MAPLLEDDIPDIHDQVRYYWSRRVPAMRNYTTKFNVARQLKHAIGGLCLLNIFSLIAACPLHGLDAIMIMGSKITHDHVIVQESSLDIMRKPSMMSGCIALFALCYFLFFYTCLRGFLNLMKRVKDLREKEVEWLTDCRRQMSTTDTNTHNIAKLIFIQECSNLIEKESDDKRFTARFFGYDIVKVIGQIQNALIALYVFLLFTYATSHVDQIWKSPATNRTTLNISHTFFS